jgi:hypothetical protein
VPLHQVIKLGHCDQEVTIAKSQSWQNAHQKEDLLLINYFCQELCHGSMKTSKLPASDFLLIQALTLVSKYLIKDHF